MRNSSDRRHATARNPRAGATGSSLAVVLATALLALLIAGVAAVVSGVHPTPHQAAATARAAAGAVTRAAASVGGAGAPISTAWLSAHPEADLEVHGQADILV